MLVTGVLIWRLLAVIAATQARNPRREAVFSNRFFVFPDRFLRFPISKSAFPASERRDEELQGLVAQWYKHARENGEPTDAYCDEVFAEVDEAYGKNDPKGAVSDVFDPADHARLRALRASDPEANLRERWSLVGKAQPDLASSRLGYVPFIIDKGWAVVPVADQQLAYTIGLKYRYGHPELLVSGPGRAPEVLGKILNPLALYVSRGHSIEAGEPVDLKDFGVSLTFARYSQAIFDRYPSGYLATFESVFDDAQYASGASLPVLWAELPPIAAQGGNPGKGGSWLGKLFGGGRSG